MDDGFNVEGLEGGADESGEEVTETGGTLAKVRFPLAVFLGSALSFRIASFFICWIIGR